VRNGAPLCGFFFEGVFLHFLFFWLFVDAMLVGALCDAGGYEEGWCRGADTVGSSGLWQAAASRLPRHVAVAFATRSAGLIK
jgi:hypothetical protein